MDKGWPRDKYDLQDDWNRAMHGYKPSIRDTYKGEPPVPFGWEGFIVGLLIGTFVCWSVYVAVRIYFFP